MNDLSNIVITKEEVKRERKHNAVKLPEHIEQCDLPIYVNYYKECYDQKNKCYREYFKIEKHPHNINNKLYVSSKSNKITILEKLEEIKKMLLIIEEEYEINNKDEQIKNEQIKDEQIKDEQIKDEQIKDETHVVKDEHIKENILQNKKNPIILPKYITIKKHETETHKYYLIYDKKSGTKRNTLKALCSNVTLFNTNLELFIKKIEEKFAT
jgi:hypothetical protein